MLTLVGLRALWLLELPALPLVLGSCVLITLVVRQLRERREPVLLQLHEDDCWSLHRSGSSIRSARLIDTRHRSARRIDLLLDDTASEGRPRRHCLSIASDSVSDVDFSYLHLHCALSAPIERGDDAALMSSVRTVARRFAPVPLQSSVRWVPGDQMRVRRSDRQ